MSKDGRKSKTLRAKKTTHSSSSSNNNTNSSSDRDINSKDNRESDRDSLSVSINNGSVNNNDDDDDEQNNFQISTAREPNPFEFVEGGPPPDMNQRQLIFDSLQKIVKNHPNRNQKTAQNRGDSRGTYVFTWGAGYHGQLGRKFIRGQKKYTAVPLPVELPVVVRQVTCGGLHTAVVTENGQVYTWGDGRKGELGHVHDPSLKQIPRPVDALDHVFVVAVACGGSHTVAITDNGIMFSWGWSKFGQTGHGDRTTLKMPRRVDHHLAREIVQVAAGNKHTVAITKSGAVLSFGCGKHGQTGQGDEDDRLDPEKIMSLSNYTMSSVACGAIHSVFLDAAGQVFLCGFGEHFHPSSSEHFFYDPISIPMPEPMRAVACGQSHNLALSVTGNVYAWGDGEYGQIGYGICANTATPRLVLDSGNIASISAGRYHSSALTSTGVLYTWGCGENGQLGLGSDENVSLPQVVTPILGTVVGAVACGEHHSACLTAAPWSKLSADVTEWLHSARVQTEMTEAYLKKTHRGLTTKDLARLKEDMKKWALENEKRKQAAVEEEKEEAKRDIASIMFEERLMKEVARDIKSRGGGRERDREKDRDRDNNNERADSAPNANNTPSSGSASKYLVLPQVHDAASNNNNNNNNNNNEEDDDTNTSKPVPTLKLPHLKQQGDVGVKYASQTDRGSGVGNSAQLSATLPIPPASHRDRAESSSSASAGVGASGGAGSSLSSTLSATVPASSSSSSSSTATASSLSLLPFARPLFLRETASMVRRMTAVIHEHSADIDGSSQSLTSLLRTVFTQRKDYDTLRHLARLRARKVAELKKEESLNTSTQEVSTTSLSVADERLAILRMKFNTVTIKIAETGENRINYELNISHLKEEDFEHFNQLKALRKANSDSNLFVKKMTELKMAANDEREKAEAELAQFRHEITSYQTFVKKQLAQFRALLESVEKMNAKRDKIIKARREKMQAHVAERIAQLTMEAAAAEKESSGLHARLVSLELKLRHFEDSFQKITAATGLSNADAIINKFFFKGEIKEQLQSEIDEKQQMIQRLRAREASLQSTLASSLASFHSESWRDVEVASEDHRESSTSLSRVSHEYEKTTQKLAFVQEGLIHLLRTTERAIRAKKDDDSSSSSSSSSSEDTELSSLSSVGIWSVSDCGSLFSRLERCLVDLQSLVASEEENRRVVAEQRRIHEERARKQERAEEMLTTLATKATGGPAAAAAAAAAAGGGAAMMMMAANDQPFVENQDNDHDAELQNDHEGVASHEAVMSRPDLLL